MKVCQSPLFYKLLFTQGKQMLQNIKIQEGELVPYLFYFKLIFFELLNPDLLRDTFEAKKRMLYNGKCVRH